MPTFAEVYRRWVKANREKGTDPLVLAEWMAREGYACRFCGHLLAPGGRCGCPSSAIADKDLLK